jgi:Tfp pilus assembly protein PilN
MVNLNLLPEKVRAAALLRVAALLGIVAYMLAALVLGWRFLAAHQDLSAVELKITKVEAELRPLQAIADEVKKLTDEKTEQDAKRSKLIELAKRQAYLIRLMDMLPDLMQGDQVWLLSLDETPDKGRVITLEGKAATMEVWADFYSNLEAQSQVSTLKIETAPAAVVDGARKTYHFKVSFTLKDPL